MRNLIAFIWRFNITILFLFLFSISILLLVNNNHYHSGKFYSFINQVSGSTYQAINNATQYLKLGDVNILEFHIKSPVSPKSIGVGNDTRLLGLGFQTIMFH